MKYLSSRAGLIAALGLAATLLPGITGCGATQPAPKAATQVIVDTDMSSDDIMALTYLLERPDVSVRAITVEGTGVADGRAGARNVLRLIRALGVRRAIPVAYGRAKPLQGSAAFPRPWRNAADQMYNLDLPKWAGAPPSGTAVRLLTDTISRAPHPICLVTLGPLTDVALALRSSPGIAGKIDRIYAMAGAIAVPGNEPTYHRAEWNAYIDPTAASIVLKSGIAKTVVPLDASNNVPITTFVTDAARSYRQSAGMRLLATLLDDPFYIQAPVYFWDPLTAVAAIDSGVLRQRTARLTVTQIRGPAYGETWTGMGGAHVTLGVSANATRFMRDFLTGLNHGRPVGLPTAPPSRRILVSYDGTSYAYHGPAIRPGWADGSAARQQRRHLGQRVPVRGRQAARGQDALRRRRRGPKPPHVGTPMVQGRVRPASAARLRRHLGRHPYAWPVCTSLRARRDERTARPYRDDRSSLSPLSREPRSSIACAAGG